MHAERRRGRQRSRILYWFRTPPGVRVGRSALDEAAIRLIEESNPGLEFDWTRILKGEGAPPAPDTPRARPEQAERRARPRGPRDMPPPPRPPAPRPEAAAEPRPVPATPAPHLEVPATEPHAGDAADPEMAVPASELPSQPESSSAAQARLGSEGLQRLRARHAEVLARISEKIIDPVRREELKAQAERLNPDTWVTDDEVVAGLEQYESVFESIRGIVGRRRRRRRRRGCQGGGDAAGQPGQAPAGGVSTPPSDDDDREDDDHPGDGDNS